MRTLKGLRSSITWPVHGCICFVQNSERRGSFCDAYGNGRGVHHKLSICGDGLSGLHKVIRLFYLGGGTLHAAHKVLGQFLNTIQQRYPMNCGSYTTHHTTYQPRTTNVPPHAQG